ncbi:methionine ABC transporter permease [Asaia spathodeae]|uniref:ABC transporter permease n=1 Tax=Asaia spathodeae TaxID=657016 RepID=A0ABX2P2J9_9PROT|nr:methionine ABC transporter permease [Asaia spathodeae]GBR18015.1 D-methionine transporter permease [Asaia spathodeae NBRC 105894]
MYRLIARLIAESTLQTVEMVAASSLVAVLFGLPLAVLMIATRRTDLYDLPWLGRPIGWVIDAVRAIPFIILLVLLIPVTRFIAGTSLGTLAAIVPLSIAAIPYYARIAEISLQEIEPGLIEAVRVMGGTRWMVIRYVLIPEALPGLLSGLTVTAITLVGASAMAGAIGAGGLGDLAIRYGYQRFNTTIMFAVVAVLILLVGIIQGAGTLAVRAVRR